MPSTGFSLSEKLVINPILQWRSDPKKGFDSKATIKEKIGHFFKAEVAARIAALSLLIFATLDALVHLLTGIYKGCCLLLSNCTKIKPLWNKFEVRDHFRLSGFFLKTAIVGTIAGAAWPKIFKQSCLALPMPFVKDDINPKDIPERIAELSQTIIRQKQPDFKSLKDFWDRSNLSTRHWFVQTFNQNEEKFKAVREALADTVYRPINPILNQNVSWLNNSELNKKVGSNEQDKAFFFHATPTKQGLKGILKTKRVEVRHEKLFRGAFVSTAMERSFGRYILGFKRNIERLSSLSHGFPHERAYWAGFSRDIPVNEATTAYIILDSYSEFERKILEDKCKKWTQRDIKVLLIRDAEKIYWTAQNMNLNLGIPKEWGEENAAVALKIHKMLKPKKAKQKKEKRKAQPVQHRMRAMAC